MDREGERGCYFPADTFITTGGRRVVVRSCSLGGSVETVGRVTGSTSTVVLGVGVGWGTGGSATHACGLSPSCIFAHRRLFVCCQPEEEDEETADENPPAYKEGTSSLTVTWRGEAVVVQQLAAIGHHLADLMIARPHTDLLFWRRAWTVNWLARTLLMAPISMRRTHAAHSTTLTRRCVCPGEWRTSCLIPGAQL